MLGGQSLTLSLLDGGEAGTGNLSGDPLFVNAASPIGSDNRWGTADDGLIPAPCSPAANTGNNTVNTATADFTGRNRVVNTTIDMGAYESQGGVLSVSIVAAPSQTITSGSSVTLTASGATSYTWSDGSTANPLIVSNVTSAMAFSVTGTTGGCSATASAAVSVSAAGNGLSVGAISPIVLSATNCPATLTFDGTGKSFIITGPGFTGGNTYRTLATRTISVGGIKTVGQYTIRVQGNTANIFSTYTFEVTGTSCP